METVKFYQIEQPTTEQIFNAIIANEYVPIEKIQSKAKQVKVLLLDYWNANELFITFSSVTNCGGVPIFYSDTTDLYEIATEQGGFYELSEEEQDSEIELLSCYAQTYDSIFNI
jgi:hypothetical protein